VLGTEESAVVRAAHVLSADDESLVDFPDHRVVTVDGLARAGRASVRALVG
jgi:hypothetical protein